MIPLELSEPVLLAKIFGGLLAAIYYVSFYARTEKAGGGHKVLE